MLEPSNGKPDKSNVIFLTSSLKFAIVIKLWSPLVEEYEYTLALASELLGLIRGKYSQIPAPGSEVTLNAADLISKGREQQTALRERLRGDFEDMSRRAQLERKQSENQSISSTLNDVPMFIYLG